MKNETKKKRFLKTIVQNREYLIDDALILLKKISISSFIETAEVSINLNIEHKLIPRVKWNILLPYGTFKLLKIAVFIKEIYIQELLNLGVTLLTLENLLEQIKLKKFNFNILLTTPNLIGQLLPLGKTLGSKGLMPSSKNGTVTEDLSKTIKEYKQGKKEYCIDKTGIIHFSFGKINYFNMELKENLLFIYKIIEKNKPNGIKGKFIKSFFISTTQSNSIKLNLTEFYNLNN